MHADWVLRAGVLSISLQFVMVARRVMCGRGGLAGIRRIGGWASGPAVALPRSSVSKMEFGTKPVSGTSRREVAVGHRASPTALRRQVEDQRLARARWLLRMRTASSKPAGPVEIRREDYKPANYAVDHTHLSFSLDSITTVKATFDLRCTSEEPRDLVLSGPDDAKDMVVVSVSVDGVRLPAHHDGYEMVKGDRGGSALRIDSKNLKQASQVETVVEIQPEKNLAMTGLYKSSGMFCTQCEAEGFRRITYSLDRPDVMSTYSVRVEADKVKFPVLLSNGNLTDSGEVAGTGRHYTVWVDPHRKPTYLFALVAGDLGVLEGNFVTQSGRDVALKIFTEHNNVGQLAFALQSLQRSMKWDEVTYGLEYDLDVFNIVAVDDFNMGAMENKSLNVFNSKYVLADKDTATDDRLIAVEAVIGHEYFHNWTGNRVTCRDWFQLTLKEGLTVFRDQNFTADMNSAAIKRIQDVLVLKSHQFAEDAGPMAHPVRPESYIAMDNFYTSTVYNKGAEVVRLYETLLSKAGFRRGMDLYFERHDGQAVTCDDFRSAMADANGVADGLAQLSRWYTTAGTPTVHASSEAYDAEAQRFPLTLTQCVEHPVVDGQQPPLLIPIRMGLLHPTTGAELAFRVVAGGEVCGDGDVLLFTETTQTFVIEVKDLPGAPVMSLLRDFSAPVKMVVEGQTMDDLAMLMAHDTDSFNRWDAAQRLGMHSILELVKSIQAGEMPVLDQRLVNSVRATLNAEGVDQSVQAYTMSLPSEMLIAQEMPIIDPDAIREARSFARRTLAAALGLDLRRVYDLASQGSDLPFVFDQTSVGRRSLRNACLSLLAADGSNEAVSRAWAQFSAANNMTESCAALAVLADLDCDERIRAFDAFEKRWIEDPNVMDTWLGLQAGSVLPMTLQRVQQLEGEMESRGWSTNPNKLRSLIGGVAGNAVLFHAKDGSGYEFVGARIRDLDAFNPQLAARLTTMFGMWKKYDEGRQALMKDQLVKIRDREGVSKETFEIAQRSLK